MIAYCALLAGHVEVEDQAFVSGNVPAHQFARIGCPSVIGGGTAVSSDVPPFIMCAGFRGDAVGQLAAIKKA